MPSQTPQFRQEEGAEIIDFDTHLLDACAPADRAEILQEARLLAHALNERDAVGLRRLAAQISTGWRDDKSDRNHARRLAAALRRLAGDV